MSPKPRMRALFAIGSHTVALADGRPRHRRPARRRLGAAATPRRHRGGSRCASGPDEVRRARQRLRAAGIAETEWQEDGNFVRVQVADPDGYRGKVFAL